MSNLISDLRIAISECLNPLRVLQSNAEIDDKVVLSPMISKLEKALVSIDSISTEFEKLKSKISDRNCPSCHKPEFKLISQSGGKYFYKCSNPECRYQERTLMRYDV